MIDSNSTNRTALSNKEAKCKMAAERQAHWDSLTTAQKVEDLDRRLGVGVGAVKQRARLAKEASKVV